MNDALAPHDIISLYHALAGAPIEVFDYSQVISNKDIDNLFRVNSACVLFYPALRGGNLTVGHYVLLIRNKESKTMFFYDPLAYKPDEYKKFAMKHLYLERHNSLINHFINKHQDGYTIDYNTHQHQSRRPDVATCGRHCILRALMSNLSHDSYHKALRKLARFCGGEASGLKDWLAVAIV